MTCRSRPTPRLAILFLAACLLPLLPALSAAQDERSGPETVAPVDVAAVRQVPIVETLSLTGSVVAPRRAALSPAIAGLVAALPVEIGDRVAAGDLLLRLDRDLEQLTLVQAEAAVREAEADLAEAQRRLQVGERLVSRRSLAENEVASRGAAMRMAEARLARLRAEAGYEAGRLARHDLRAPFAGVIAERAVELGEWVEPGDALLQLVAVDGLLVDAAVPEGAMPRVGPDTGIRAQFDALPGRQAAASFVTLVPVSDPASRAALLRVRPDMPADAGLAPGMSARLELRLGGGPGLAVSRDALLRHADGRVTLWLVEEGGTVAERRVEPGRQFDGLVELRDGPPAGSLVVVRGNEALRPGQQVRIRERLETAPEAGRGAGRDAGDDAPPAAGG